ncbi:MAG: VWA domain-containing protein [Spirochaetaceae bacterium]|nr:VWA domain-containing protein [Spirochaetaceae bacterium]
MPRRYWLSTLFFGMFVGCCVTALAGPRWGRRFVPEYRRGIDVVFGFDLSRSMDVQDELGRDGKICTRLERGKEIALETVGTFEGVRFGAAIAKGRGAVAVPLTYDAETMTRFLEGLSGDSVTGRGTNLETLLEAGGEAFLEALPTRRGIVLFSDGEAWSGSLSGALERLAERDIAVIAVGLGTETGGIVPAAPGEEPSVSCRRSEVLQNIAERTGGLWVDGHQGNAPDLLVQGLRGLSAGAETKGGRLEAQARWELFVLAGLVCLGASKLLEKRFSHGS